MRIQPPLTSFQPNGYRPEGTGSQNSSSAIARAGALNATTADSVFPSSRFDSDATAENILDFVQQQLTRAAANGASKEQLTSLLQQARDGAQSGFDSAIAQLRDTGELDDVLTGGISAALQQVDKGFEALAKQLGIEAPTPSSVPAKDASPGATLSELASRYNGSFANGQSADLEVRTADGDTIRLRIGAASQQDANGVRSSGGITVSVDGELDADETKALNELVDRVGKLADSFFGGDMDDALAQADAFQFDNPELSSLSLTLRRTSVSAYQDVESLGKNALAAYGAGNDSGTDSAGIAASTRVNTALASELSALLPAASFAENPAGALKQLLAAQVAGRDQQDNPLLDFANRLLDAMGANRTAPTNGLTAGSAQA